MTPEFNRKRIEYVGYISFYIKKRDEYRRWMEEFSNGQRLTSKFQASTRKEMGEMQ